VFILFVCIVISQEMYRLNATVHPNGLMTEHLTATKDFSSRISTNSCLLVPTESDLFQKRGSVLLY